MVALLRKGFLVAVMLLALLGGLLGGTARIGSTSTAHALASTHYTGPMIPCPAPPKDC